MITTKSRTQSVVDLQKSKKSLKRYRVTMADGRTFDFGSRFGSTYVDHGDTKRRAQYWARHYNQTEKQLIDNLIVSPSLLSAYLLWGKYTDIYSNIGYLNELWRRKYKNKK